MYFLFQSMLAVHFVSAVPDGYVHIGKIVYNPKEVLGHGCEGTFVYK